MWDPAKMHLTFNDRMQWNFNILAIHITAELILPYPYSAHTPDSRFSDPNINPTKTPTSCICDKKSAPLSPYSPYVDHALTCTNGECKNLNLLHLKCGILYRYIYYNGTPRTLDAALAPIPRPLLRLPHHTPSQKRAHPFAMGGTQPLVPLHLFSGA